MLTPINQFYPTGKEVVPEVGMGCTEILWSDRHAFTVIEVTKSRDGVIRRCKVQADKAIRTDNNGMSDCQSYRFERDPNGGILELKLTKKGWNHKGTKFSMGTRDEHYDFCL